MCPACRFLESRYLASVVPFAVLFLCPNVQSYWCWTIQKCLQQCRLVDFWPKTWCYCRWIRWPGYVQVGAISSTKSLDREHVRAVRSLSLRQPSSRLLNHLHHQTQKDPHESDAMREKLLLSCALCTSSFPSSSEYRTSSPNDLFRQSTTNFHSY